MNIAAVFLFPAIGLLILILGPAIRNKILKHGQKEKGINPSKHHSPLTYASEDLLYRATFYSSAGGNYKPLGDIAKMIDTDE